MATGFTDPWTPAFQPLERWETKRVAGSFRATASVPVAAAHGGRGPRLPRAVLPWCGRGCAGRGAQLGTSPAAVPTQGSRRGRPGPLAPLWAFPSRPPLAMAFLDTCCPCLPPRWGDGSLPLAAAWHTGGGNDRQCLARPCRRESCLGDLGWPWLASLGHDVPRRPSAPRTSAGCSGGSGPGTPTTGTPPSLLKCRDAEPGVHRAYGKQILSRRGCESFRPWSPAGCTGTQWAAALCPATSAEETAHRLWGPRGSCRPSRGH